jgi:hypothetical protein
VSLLLYFLPFFYHPLFVVVVGTGLALVNLGILLFSTP